MRIQRVLGATSSSLFVLDGDTLRGAVGEWDWTRTSFAVLLEGWPTVKAGLESGRPTFITAAEARGAEAGWFEIHGVAGALCVPLRVEERTIGVLFLDFEVAHCPNAASMAFAENVAVPCAAALERALRKDVS